MHPWDELEVAVEHDRECERMRRERWRHRQREAITVVLMGLVGITAMAGTILGVQHVLERRLIAKSDQQALQIRDDLEARVAKVDFIDAGTVMLGGMPVRQWGDFRALDHETGGVIAAPLDAQCLCMADSPAATCVVRREKDRLVARTDRTGSVRWVCFR